jgi:hypothetical protein
MKPFMPVYGDVDVGSTIQDIKGLIAKIETNKYDKKDIVEFAKKNNNIIIAIISQDVE